MILKLFLPLLALLSVPAQAKDLISWSEDVLTQIKGTGFIDTNCVPFLNDLGSKIDAIQPNSFEATRLKVDAEALTQNLWLSRLALHDHLKDASMDCAREIRNTFRRFRFIEDFLSEVKASPENLNPDRMSADDFQTQAVPTRESAPYYLLQTRDSHFELQAGDIMIARGVSFLSAMIARLGDIDSQFSHVILVVKNPQTQKLETIESYVGEGVNFHEMNWALKNNNSRLLVLRPKNNVIAEKAASDMWQLVNSHQDANKIHYDYALDFKDHETMSCAEVAQYAYSKAGADLGVPFSLPERPSTLTHGLNLLEHLGVTPGNTFTPGDLEYDSRFEIVAEWRDLRMTLDSRIRDAIMTKVLSWMDQDDSTLHPSMKSKLARGPIWTLRRTFLWPLVKKILKKDFSKEVPRNMVGTLALITQLADGMLAELQTRDTAYALKTGYHFTYVQLYAELEKIKLEDKPIFENRRTRKHSIIFKYLR
ncbi:MAG: hypothetical protein H7333_02690 [Bdellovibrionales bacterium]|nr:hypothetical protein [Oligoflexia bacterium]